jgi:aminoglycoside phosphotransferase (APT) family kinase protein
MAANDPATRPTVSVRDVEATRPRLEAWLASKLPAGAAPRLSELRRPEGSGMSSETLLFDADWAEDGAARRSSLVARLAPTPHAVPVFPRYDMAVQFRLLDLVRRRSGVPVPAVRWFEPDPAVLGVPFFVMDAVEGRVPADIPSYNMAGWVFDASPEERNRLERASVARLAELHGLAASEEELTFLQLPAAGDTPLRRHVADQIAYYDWTVADGVRSPLIERGFRWLEEHWPEEPETVVSWGDSRVGHIVYQGFEPAALLDWEMAALGPRELDVGWMIVLHQFFEGIAHRIELPGLPDFLRREEVASAYEASCGRPLRNLEWFETYAALRHGIVMFRIMRRTVHFGEGEMPDDPEDSIMHRDLIERMLDGTHWSTS